jgi:hypothetical protein
LIIFISINSKFDVVLLYNFKIIFYEKHFENTQVKHTTKLISFQTQCNDSTFVDKLFKSVFKSCRFDKICFKKLFKNYYYKLYFFLLLLIKWLWKSHVIWLQDNTLKNCLNIGKIGSVWILLSTVCRCFIMLLLLPAQW